jgi:hypothetical protein
MTGVADCLVTQLHSNGGSDGYPGSGMRVPRFNWVFVLLHAKVSTVEYGFCPDDGALPRLLDAETIVCG